MSTEKHRVVRVINLYKTGDLFICLIFMPKSSKTENIYIEIIKVTKKGNKNTLFSYNNSIWYICLTFSYKIDSKIHFYSYPTNLPLSII